MESNIEEIKFEDGSTWVILKHEYKDKSFSTMWDAAVALHASIKEYCNPKYQEKLFCYELIDY